MKFLFFDSFMTKDYDTLIGKLELVAIMWVVVLIAIIIDLISGLRKATKEGIVHTSYGFRRTVTKAVQYYGLLCFAFMFDILSSLVLHMPYFSMLASVFLVFIEAKSVFEKAHEKDRHQAHKDIKDFITLLENKDDLLKGIMQLLKKSNKSKDEKNDNNE